MESREGGPGRCCVTPAWGKWRPCESLRVRLTNRLQGVGNQADRFEDYRPDCAIHFFPSERRRWEFFKRLLFKS